MKRLLVTCVAFYIVSGWLLPMLGLAFLAPFQFLIAAILVGWAFKVAKAIGYIVLFVAIIHLLLYLMQNGMPLALIK